MGFVTLIANCAALSTISFLFFEDTLWAISAQWVLERKKNLKVTQIHLYILNENATLLPSPKKDLFKLHLLYSSTGPSYTSKRLKYKH